MRNNQSVESRRLKVKGLGVATLFAFTLFLSTAGAQTLNVKQSNGSNTAYALSDVKKITFSGGNVIVTKTNNSNGAFALNGLRHLIFTDVKVDAPVLKSVGGQLKVYPNPATNELNIALSQVAAQGEVLTIYNFEGKTMLSQKISQADVLTLNIAHLPAGIYLCRLSNRQETKTVKFIKQ